MSAGQDSCTNLRQPTRAKRYMREGDALSPQAQGKMARLNQLKHYFEEPIAKGGGALNGALVAQRGGHTHILNELRGASAEEGATSVRK